MSILEEGYLIEEGGLVKFQKRYKGGHFLIRGGSDKPKILQEGGIDRRGGSNTHLTVL